MAKTVAIFNIIDIYRNVNIWDWSNSIFYPENICWSSRRFEAYLQCNNFSSSKDVLQIRLEDISTRKIVKPKTWTRLEDVTWRRLEEMSWIRLEYVLETNTVFTGGICIKPWPTNKSKSVSNKSHKSIFNESEENPKCINKNPIISIFVLFWNSISRINSKSTLQNRWGNKNEVLNKILHEYNEWSFILTFTFKI